MAIEHGSFQPERGVEQENLPSEIRIYAVEGAQTHEDHMTKHGHGFSTPLESPRKCTLYKWEGKLHPSEFERQHPESRENYLGAEMSQSDLVKLAENLAANVNLRQDPDLQKKGESSYALIFGPSKEKIEKFVKQADKGETIRGLFQRERERFMEAFLRAAKSEN